MAFVDPVELVGCNRSSPRRWALEDPQQLPGEEAIPFAQDLGKGVCPSTSFFLPDYDTLQ